MCSWRLHIWRGAGGRASAGSVAAGVPSPWRVCHGEGLAQRRARAQVYAWKLLALEDALRRHAAVLWLDAGSTVVGPLGAVGDALLRDGYFLVQGQVRARH